MHENGLIFVAVLGVGALMLFSGGEKKTASRKAVTKPSAKGSWGLTYSEQLLDETLKHAVGALDPKVLQDYVALPPENKKAEVQRFINVFEDILERTGNRYRSIEKWVEKNAPPMLQDDVLQRVIDGDPASEFLQWANGIIQANAAEFLAALQNL